LGFPPLTAVENLVFNIYPLYLFLGMWLGKRRPDLLLRFVQVFAVLFCIYAPAYFLYLNKINVMMPGSGVPLFGQAGGGGFIILSLLCLDPKPGRWWPVMAIAACGFLAAQVRGEWLGIVVATMIWGVLSKKMAKVAMLGAGIFALLAVGAILDVNLPSTGERGGAIASSEIVARGLAAASPDLARDLTGSTNVNFYNGTITWRKNWWRAIWANSQDNYTNLLIGPGYGFALKNLVNYLAVATDLRTPHNVFYYALGYTGWIGVSIFFSLQAAFAVLLWRVYKLTGEAWGLAAWSATLVSAFFGNVMETPAGAIPLYLLIGLFVGPVLGALSSPAREALSYPAGSSAAYSQQTEYASEGI
jgi:O-Antigen ligase